MLVNCVPGREERVAETLKALPWVRAVLRVLGPFDLVVLVEVPSSEELKRLVTKHIRRVDGVTATTTLLVYGRYEGFSG